MSQLLHAFNTANTSRQIGAEETAVGGRPIAQHHYSVESQARFRTIPVNELIDGVTITPLRVQAGEAIQDCGFGVLEVWQTQDRFCSGTFSSWCGFRFMTDGLHATINDRVMPRRYGQGCPSSDHNRGLTLSNFR